MRVLSDYRALKALLPLLLKQTPEFPKEIFFVFSLAAAVQTQKSPKSNRPHPVT